MLRTKIHTDETLIYIRRLTGGCQHRGAPLFAAKAVPQISVDSALIANAYVPTSIDLINGLSVPSPVIHIAYCFSIGTTQFIHYDTAAWSDESEPNDLHTQHLYVWHSYAHRSRNARPKRLRLPPKTQLSVRIYRRGCTQS